MGVQRRGRERGRGGRVRRREIGSKVEEERMGEEKWSESEKKKAKRREVMERAVVALA